MKQLQSVRWTAMNVIRVFKLTAAQLKLIHSLVVEERSDMYSPKNSGKRVSRFIHSFDKYFLSAPMRPALF